LLSLEDSLEVSSHPSASPLSPESVQQTGCKPRRIGDFVYDLLTRYEIVSLTLLLVFVFIYAAVASLHKPLWFDELFTIIVATQPTLHKFAQAMPPEGNPPINTLLTRFFIHIFGLTEFSVRLAPMFSFLAALTGIYVFVRRECGVVFGLLAVVLTLSQPAWEYSFEARPYGLLLAFLMLALVSWQSATRAADGTPRQSRHLALAGIVIGIAGSILSHNIGVVEVGVPLLFGEAVRTYSRRRPDWPLLATALAVIPAMAITLPMIRHTNSVIIARSPTLTFPLNLWKVIKYGEWAQKSWSAVINTQFVLILIVVVLATWAPRFMNRSRQTHELDDRDDSDVRIAPHILSAAVGATLLIPITWLAMMSARGWYFCRYGIGTVAGIAILTCLLLARNRIRDRAFVVSLLALFALTYVHNFYHELREHRPTTAADKLVYGDKSNLPIVVSDPLLYPTVWWYAPAGMKDRIIYLGDAQALLEGPYGLVEAGLLAEKPFTSAPLKDYNSFIRTHDHFLLDLGQPEPTAALKDRLVEAGYTTTLLSTEGTERLFDVQLDPQRPPEKSVQGQTDHKSR